MNGAFLQINIHQMSITLMKIKCRQYHRFILLHIRLVAQLRQPGITIHLLCEEARWIIILVWRRKC